MAFEPNRRPEEVPAPGVVQDRGALLAAISNAMVGLKKEYYGKGPTKSKTFIDDVYVFCVLEGGLTRNEQTLLDAGEEDLVRRYRLRFQEVMKEQAHSAVERVTGCRVLGYHSQVVFQPERMFEIFILDRAPLSDPRADPVDGRPAT